MKKQDVIKVEATDQDFTYWLNRPYIDNDLRASLSEANLLIVPREDYPGHTGPIFPQSTDQLLNFLKENSPSSVIPDVCISDEDYTDLMLHHDWFDVGAIVTQSFIAPVVVTLVLDYVKKRRADNPNIKVTLTVVEPNNVAKQMMYEGPVERFKDTINQAMTTPNAAHGVETHSVPTDVRLSQNEPEPDQSLSSRSSY